MPKILLHAPNVHVGGGLVLLEALLRHWPHATGQALHGILDARARDRLAPVCPDGSTFWTTSSLRGRYAAERHLQAQAAPGDTVLCFHGLPPLLHHRARTVVFVQNRLLIESTSLAHYALPSRLRLHGERTLCHRRRHQVAAYLVQTPSMARLLSAWHGGDPTVHVVPFMDDLPLARALAASPASGAAVSWDFVYVADGEAHKNHRVLLQAWQRLAAEGLRPTLALTLSPRDAGLRQQIDEAVAQHGLRITDLGHRPHAEVLALYRQASALIFPSTTESFGLPLIEARRLGLPILAPELDYVRDVCEPAETFDPHSAVSMARAVRRFLGQSEPIAPVVTPERFIAHLTL
ncbi:glycosyltransferase [Sphaerotilus sp.]|uniref:glycosyltransferase n=1 Tax=Sphaerotilus sp. TaxID=2093942 RepID=UPI002ACE65F4|nr:glycosyltransferase [Sphaerotilus sp.]MDZ7857574.1 glycosyltransferase [Sphaerotilus sp.]